MSDQTEQLEKLGEEWATAELSGDTGYLGHILADDFVAIGPRGFMLTKEQWLSRHDSGSLKYESFGWDEVRVRVHGDAAVMTGRETAEGGYEDRDVRHDIQERFRVTLVFVKEQECWLLFSLHLSPISGRPREIALRADHSQKHGCRALERNADASYTPGPRVSCA